MLNNLKTFGMNVIPDHQETITYATEKIEDAITSLWEPVLGYLKENDNVFSGEVLDEIEKMNTQSMKIGMAYNAVTEKRNISYES